MPSHGPRWTRARLSRVLIARFGAGPRGGVDTRAVAAAMGVSQRSVQRWLHADGRRRAPIPAARLADLTTLLAPDELLLLRRSQQARYARNAIAQLTTNPLYALESWEEQGWLEQHRVAIIANPQLRIRRVVIGRVDAVEFDSRRDGSVIAQVRMPTRFHAILLTESVLRSVQAWRVQLDGRGQTATTSWFDDAPFVDLAELARSEVDS